MVRLPIQPPLKVESRLGVFGLLVGFVVGFPFTPRLRKNYIYIYILYELLAPGLV